MEEIYRKISQVSKKSLIYSILIIFSFSLFFLYKNYMPTTFEILFDKENPKVKNFEKIFSNENQMINKPSKVSYYLIK